MPITTEMPTTTFAPTQSTLEIPADITQTLALDPVTTEIPATVTQELFTTKTTTEEPKFTGVIQVPAGLHDQAINQILSYKSDLISADDLTELELHGCHCWKLSGLSNFVSELGGLKKIDEIDDACSSWHEARKCISLPGGQCFSEDLEISAYELNVTEGIVDLNCNLNASNDCLEAVCLIDILWAEQIINRIGSAGSFTAVAGDSDMCPFCETCVPGSGCSGLAPDVRIFH